MTTSITAAEPANGPILPLPIRSTTPLELDDVPLVHSVFVFSDDETCNLSITDTHSKAISNQFLKTHGKDLNKVNKDLFQSAAIKSRHELECRNHTQTYVLYIFRATLNETAIFLTDKSDKFVSNFALDSLDDNALLILPFLDGALSRFLQRSEIYGIGAGAGGGGGGGGSTQSSTSSSSKSSSPSKKSKKSKSKSKSKNRSKSVVASAADDNHTAVVMHHITVPGIKTVKNSRSSRITSHETFSLEEVFRLIDVDGNGSIDISEFEAGLNSMGLTFNATDVELLFEAITNTISASTPASASASTPSTNNPEISFSQFYSFFGGRSLARRNHQRSTSYVSSASNSRPLSPNAGPFLGTSAPNMLDKLRLQTVTEDMGEELEEDHKSQQMTSLSETHEANAETKVKIETLKMAVRSCLNLGEDHSLFTPHMNNSIPPSPFDADADAVDSTSAQSGSTYAAIDISAALSKLQLCDELLSIMESNIYQCPTNAAMVKWDNRCKGHRIRISNFRKLLNNILQLRMKSMEDDKQTLLQQLESARDAGAYPSSEREDVFAMMGNLHNSNLASLIHKGHSRKGSVSKKRGRQSVRGGGSAHARSYSSASDFSDVSSVESEVDLVYVPGTSIKGNEAERLMKRVKEQKKEIKKLVKEIKVMKMNFKKVEIKLQAREEQHNKQLRKREKERQNLLDQQQMTRNSLLKLRKNKNTSLLSASDAKANSKNSEEQRNLFALRKQIKNMQNDIDQKTDLISNLKERLRRSQASSSKSDSNAGGSGTVSLRKIARLEKEVSNCKQEIAAKQKKLDEMFLKWKKAQKQLELTLEENAELNAKYAAQSVRHKDLNKRFQLLAEEQNDNSQSAKDLRRAEEKLQRLIEKLSRLKSRNRKLSKRVKELLTRLETYEAMNEEAEKLMRLLNELRQEKHDIELQIAREKNVNSSLQERLAALKHKIKSTTFEFEQSSERMDAFKNELNAEYSMIRMLQQSMEAQADVIAGLESENQNMEASLESKQNESTDREEELNIQILRLEAQLQQQTKVNARYKGTIQHSERKIESLGEKLFVEEEKVQKLHRERNDFLAQMESLAAEVALLKARNAQLSANELQYSKVATELKESNENMDELLSRIETMEKQSRKLMNELRLKSAAFDELTNELRESASEQAIQARKISKLNLQIQDVSSRQLNEDDETKIILKTYKTQIVKIEEDKKRMELLREQANDWKTKYELQKEACIRSETARLNLTALNEEQERQLKHLEQENLRLQKQRLNFSDTKNSSTMALLKKNVIELESIVRTKDFEIKKLRNINQAQGISNAEVDLAKMKRLEKEVRTLKKQATKLEMAKGNAKDRLSRMRLEMQSKSELMAGKNAEIARQKFAIQEYAQNQALGEQRKMDKEQARQRLSKNLTQQKIESDGLHAQIAQLQSQLKHTTKLQYKIGTLESELLLKDDVLANIRNQYGISNVGSVTEREIDAQTAAALGLKQI